MAISRPLLLALLGVALLGATVFAVQNARNTSGDAVAPVTQSADPAAEQVPAEPAQASPQELLSAALTTDALESASFDGRVIFRSRGERNVVETSGAFEIGESREMPKADVRVSIDSQDLDATGGFVTTGHRAWFTRGGTGYAVPQAAWEQIVEAVESGAEPAAGASAAPELDVDPARWLSGVESEGEQQLDGVATTHISADVSSAAVIADIARAMDATGQIPAGIERRVKQVVGDGRIEAWVGEDQILRRVTLELSGRGDADRVVEMDLRFDLTSVNEPQDIARPAKVEQALPGGVYGQFATGVVSGLANSAGVEPARLDLDVPATNGPRRAERAVAKKRKVVIFFQNPRALDDQAVAGSVRSLARRSPALVLTDHVGNVDRYGSLVEDLGVSQAPAIVIIDRRGAARLIEGYIDAESLVQVVADAR